MDGLKVNTTEQSQPDGVIDSITQGMSRKALNTRLKMLYRINPSNASTICEHILSEQTELNIKTSTFFKVIQAIYRGYCSFLSLSIVRLAVADLF
jgi:hypothetical protein